MSENDDTVLVIGAGSTGSSVAYHLSRAGCKVVLVDSGQIASGMTSRSTALVRTHYSNEVVARMALYSMRILKNFSEMGESGFVNSGLLIVADAEARAGILANQEMLSRIGVDSEIIEKEDAKRRFPEINFGDSGCILFEPESGYADPVATATSYASKALQLGTTILTGNKVEKILVESGRVSGVLLSDGSKIKSARVMLCTNIWTNRLLQASGVPDDLLLPLWSAAHPVIIIKRPESYQGVRTIIADFPNKAYYKPEGSSLLFAGSLDPELDRERSDPDSPPSDVPFEFISSISDALSSRIPEMSKGTLHSTYIGMYDMTPDQHPIIDELSEFGLAGAYCCVGLSGHGFKLCPALGLVSAELLTGKEPKTSEFDWSCFSLSRFRSGRTLNSKYSGIGTIA